MAQRSADARRAADPWSPTRMADYSGPQSPARGADYSGWRLRAGCRLLGWSSRGAVSPSVRPTGRQRGRRMTVTRLAKVVTVGDRWALKSRDFWRQQDMPLSAVFVTVA